MTPEERVATLFDVHAEIEGLIRHYVMDVPTLARLQDVLLKIAAVAEELETDIPVLRK